MRARDYRTRAREALSGNWLISAVVVFIASLMGGAYTSGSGGSFNFSNTNYQGLGNNLPSFVIAILMVIFAVAIVIAIITFIIGGTIRLGHCRYLLDQQDGLSPTVGTLFSQFYQFGNGFCLSLLTGIYTALWTLLFIIPGIVASYSYAMAPFIQVEHPEYGANNCIKRSKEMMRGHRWALFCLDMSFIGWSILCIFSLGVGYPFLNAYKSAAHAAFYRDIQ